MATLAQKSQDINISKLPTGLLNKKKLIWYLFLGADPKGPG
jgi:hypothetical protein